MTGQIVPAQHTGWPADLAEMPRARRPHAAVLAAQDEWVRSRYAALLAELTRTGAATPERAAEAAAAVVTHWARETGWGASEWDFSIGNIKAYANWNGLRQTLPDGLSYRAYASLEEGVRNTLGLLLAPLYRAAWDRLASGQTDAVGWYDALMRAGWHPWTQAALDDYRGVYTRVRRVVGLAPAPTATPHATAPTAARGVAAIALGTAALAAAITL